MWIVTPPRHDGLMNTAHTSDFAQAARQLTMATRAEGLVAPGFRCPPRLVGVDRSLRRRGDTAVVAVRVRDRPVAAVLADMIEGIINVNELRSPDSDRVRAVLWAATADLTVHLEPKGDETGGTIRAQVA
jgi:hypothetical protein